MDNHEIKILIDKYLKLEEQHRNQLLLILVANVEGENSEYDDAKNEQAILEARIADIEASLKNAVIIDESEISNDRVHLGSTVKIKNLANDMEMTIRIVGSNESDPKKLQISDESPVGMGLLGKSIDDVAEIETPGGVVAYKVMEISR